MLLLWLIHSAAIALLRLSYVCLKHARYFAAVAGAPCRRLLIAAGCHAAARSRRRQHRIQ